MPSPDTPHDGRESLPRPPDADATQPHAIILPASDGGPGAGALGAGPDLLAEHRAAIDALPAGSALLVVHHGPQAGARFLLNTPTITAGRRPEHDIFLDDATVSRKHAVFLWRGGSYVVRDEGSLNGTYVNGVSVQEAVLRRGDEIRIGKFRLTFHPGPRGAA